MNIVLLGAPGSGKGTISKYLTNDFDIKQISTGDIIRDNIKNKTPLGILSEKLINAGNLVPDDLMIDLVKQRLSLDDLKSGYILDGFPRTISQAIALDNFSKVDIAILLDVDFETIKNRILTRRLCPICKKIYNVNTYKNDFCEDCNTKLIIRKDDNEESLLTRFDVYNTESKSIIDYYKNKNLLYTVDGKLNPDEVYEQIKSILKKVNK